MIEMLLSGVCIFGKQHFLSSLTYDACLRVRAPAGLYGLGTVLSAGLAGSDIYRNGGDTAGLLYEILKRRS